MCSVKKLTFQTSLKQVLVKEIFAEIYGVGLPGSHGFPDKKGWMQLAQSTFSSSLFLSDTQTDAWRWKTHSDIRKMTVIL